MFKIYKNFVRNYCTTYKTTSLLNIFHNSVPKEKICVKGWVKSLRKMKQNIFIDLSDGSCDHKLQIIIPSAIKPDDLTTGASVQAKGCLNTTPKGQLELNAENLTVTGQCVVSDGYPFAPRKTYPPEYVREYLHFRPRTNKFASLLRTRHACTKIINDYFDSEGFFNIHTPIITSNDCEGAGEVFNIQPESKELLKMMRQEKIPLEEAYFNRKAFLTVSGQLHLEAAVHGLSKVYTFGPTFRAENSKSRLHLSEFYMIEAEIAFIEHIENLCEFLENFLKTITKNTLRKCEEDILRIQGDEKIQHSWIDKKFAIMSYEEALGLLEKNKNKISIGSKETGFTKEQEILLVELNGGVPVFVINWPKEMKPFYMRTCPHDKTKVKHNVYNHIELC